MTPITAAWMATTLGAIGIFAPRFGFILLICWGVMFLAIGEKMFQ